MPFLVAIQMDGERQVGRWPIIVNALFQQQGVGAKVDILAALDDAFDNLG